MLVKVEAIGMRGRRDGQIVVNVVDVVEGMQIDGVGQPHVFVGAAWNERARGVGDVDGAILAEMDGDCRTIGPPGMEAEMKTWEVSSVGVPTELNGRDQLLNSHYINMSQSSNQNPPGQTLLDVIGSNNDHAQTTEGHEQKTEADSQSSN
ncbi:hypothetical protein CGLO_06912 [Colletotrichum gloeosporioides Cg-14]|uniref:Uncharacterized protein n=1 Tax=Colletotrichum gloeosporioides (strain Cg-14) TaxID=1237896 RepID=T0KKI6_COLGC|nr:hypothetical protein CGLO_06912 [Colletotrichum gloeosporioides Cg-14]